MNEAMTGDAETLEAMRAYIDAHLTDPALTPELLRRNFGCSRATLYRYFAPVGGVAQYIRRARLQGVYWQLLSSDERETVAALSLRWGFGDPSHFCRLFRKTFGATPSEIREMGRAMRLAPGGHPIECGEVGVSSTVIPSFGGRPVPRRAN